MIRHFDNIIGSCSIQAAQHSWQEAWLLCLSTDHAVCGSDGVYLPFQDVVLRALGLVCEEALQQPMAMTLIVFSSPNT